MRSIIFGIFAAVMLLTAPGANSAILHYQINYTVEEQSGEASLSSEFKRFFTLDSDLFDRPAWTRTVALTPIPVSGIDGFFIDSILNAPAINFAVADGHFDQFNVLVPAASNPLKPSSCDQQVCVLGVCVCVFRSGYSFAQELDGTWNIRLTTATAGIPANLTARGTYEIECLDMLQAAEPTALALLLTAGLFGLGLRRNRHKSRKSWRREGVSHRTLSSYQLLRGDLAARLPPASRASSTARRGRADIAAAARRRFFARRRHGARRPRRRRAVGELLRFARPSVPGSSAAAEAACRVEPMDRRRRAARVIAVVRSGPHSVGIQVPLTHRDVSS